MENCPVSVFALLRQWVVQRGMGWYHFLWLLCGEEMEYITFTMEELEAGISHSSQPQTPAKAHQVAVSAQTFIGLVLKVSLTGFRFCVCWGCGQVVSPRNCSGLTGLGLIFKKLLFATERTAKMESLLIKSRSCEITIDIGAMHKSATTSVCDGHGSFCTWPGVYLEENKLILGNILAHPGCS